MTTTDHESLETRIDAAFAKGAAAVGDRHAEQAFFDSARCAEPWDGSRRNPGCKSPSGWRVHAWVKRGILLGFRLGRLEARRARFHLVDKHTFPPRRFTPSDGVRMVPGGSAVRSGAYLAPGVVCTPPMYVNVGAYVDECTMVDSHALVGSCSQIGKRVHLSAAAQIGGVLEPVNASPVILEDDVLVGGNCGVYEGT